MGDALLKRDSELAYLSIESCTGESQLVHRGVPVALVAFQRGFDEPPLELLLLGVEIADCGLSFPGGIQHGGIVDFDFFEHGPAVENQPSFDGRFQLAHVSRPMIIHQRIDCIAADFRGANP